MHPRSHDLFFLQIDFYLVSLPLGNQEIYMQIALPIYLLECQISNYLPLFYLTHPFISSSSRTFKAWQRTIPTNNAKANVVAEFFFFFFVFGVVGNKRSNLIYHAVHLQKDVPHHDEITKENSRCDGGLD